MYKKTFIFALWLSIAALFIVGCGSSPEPTATLYPTYTPYPPPTPYPTYTPYPEPTPYPTFTPYPDPTPYPTYTPYPGLDALTSDLPYLFCEYEFCIGRPSEAYLTDTDAPDNWNEYENGVLIGINTAGSFMAIDWEKIAHLEWVLEEQAIDVANSLGEVQGEVVIEQIGPFDIALAASLDNTSETLPYGFVAAWYCGDRGFRAAVFNKSEALPEKLLREALKLFTCNN